MKPLVRRFLNEPAFALGLINAGVQAIQLTALPLPGWANALVATVGAIGAALTTRQLVRPDRASEAGPTA